MATQYDSVIQNLYVAYFNRPADPAGLAYWAGIVAAAGGDTSAVSATFARSPEYEDAFAGKDHGQVVDQIYQNLFGHAPDAAGRAYYKDLLDSAKLSVDLVVAEVAKGALTTDKSVLENKIAASVAFTAAVDTPAEKEAYSGDEANAVAKEWLKGITTTASLEAAIDPEALDATIADVVDAGTPFTLTGALADLAAANEAKAEFLVTADGDDDEDTSADEDDIAENNVDAVNADIDAALFAQGRITTAGDYTAASTGVKAAILADAIDLNAKALAAANKAYDTAVKAADKVDGLVDAISDLAAAEDAAEAAADAAAVTAAAQLGAEANYEALNSAIVINADGTVTGLIELDDDDNLVLVDGIKESTNKGVTALLNSIKANLAAAEASDAAADAQADAEFAVDILDVNDGAAEHDAIVAGLTIVELDEDEVLNAAHINTEIAGLTAVVTAAQAALDALPPADQAGSDEEADLAAAQLALTTFEGLVADFVAADNGNPLAEAVALKLNNPDAALNSVEEWTDAIEALDELVSDLADAKAAAAELADLNDAIDAAVKVFTDEGLKAPVTLGSAAAATTGSDIFVVGEDTTTSTIANFGLKGDDMLYIGSGYTLNASTSSKLTGGDDTKLEVFFIKNGSSTDVYVETKAFGSNSTEAEIKITLTGVAPADLHFENGIITVA